jgi:predicted dehydrogenase
MARLRLAVIGVGHLGKEHARILAGMPEVDLVGVADVNPEQAQAVARRLGIQSYTDSWPLLNLVDAATIAVPTTFHFAVAAEFLRRGIPLLVEKPLAAGLQEAELLVELAGKHGALLQVGHIERFNGAFEELSRRPLQPKYVSCERLGPYTGRSTDIGVVLDLMIHDLDLLLALVRSPVRTVEAVGVSLFGGQEDVANARLHFANGCIADVTASRASPTPSRRMHVWAPEGYARADFRQRRLLLAQPAEHLRRSGPEGRASTAARARLAGEPGGGCFEFLELDCDQGDQLTGELRHFVECVQSGASPRVNGVHGREALALAERVLQSLRAHRWEGEPTGPAGPLHVPAPVGPLFKTGRGDVAA